MIAILATIVIATAAQAPPPQKSLLQQVVPNPTGANGYEDYLRAADMIDGAQLGIYLGWTPDTYEELLKALNPDPSLSEKERYGGEKPTKERLAFAKRLDGMSRLEVHREAVARYGKALDLVAVGNRKRIWDPRTSLDAMTLFPEYAKFKALARLADIASFVAFADGQSLRGTKYLLDSYQLGVNLESGVLIANLVGVAIQSISLAAIERHLDSISRADAAMIEASVPPLLGGRPRILNALDLEQQMTLSGLSEALKGGEMVGATLWGTEMSDDATKSLTLQLERLSPQQKENLLAKARKSMEARLVPVRKRFAGPESGWMASSQTAKEDEEEEFQPPSNPDEFVDYLVKSCTGIWSQAGSASAKSRTQLRLLGLSASVIRYKWDHGKLPNALADAVAADRVKDPLSQGDFQYERQGAWGFRVFSKGAPGIGEIGLKYRRQPTQNQDDGGPPPPTE